MEAVSLDTLIQTILPYVYALVAIAAIFALVQLGRLFGTVSKQVDEMGDKAQPIIDKANTSVDALNAELLRVDGILSDVERITDAAANTSQSIEKVSNAPLEIAQSLSERLLALFKSSARDSDGFSHDTPSNPAKAPAEDTTDYVTSLAGMTAASTTTPPPPTPSVATPGALHIPEIHTHSPAADTSPASDLLGK